VFRPFRIYALYAPVLSCFLHAPFHEAKAKFHAIFLFKNYLGTVNVVCIQIGVGSKPGTGTGKLPILNQIWKFDKLQTRARTRIFFPNRRPLIG
ncbi:MAG: hypothetical protein MJA29_09785, partial [Candidatus Omnitrophica bacterium]|nr:hypothetical protein [Candidatus Omnitrophota bacterium]